MNETTNTTTDSIETLLGGLEQSCQYLNSWFKSFHDSLNGSNESYKITTTYNSQSSSFTAALYGVKLRIGMVREFVENPRQSTAKLVVYHEITDANEEKQWRELSIGKAQFNVNGEGTAETIFPGARRIKSRLFSRGFVLACALKARGLEVDQEIVS